MQVEINVREREREPGAAAGGRGPVMFVKEGWQRGRHIGEKVTTDTNTFSFPITSPIL